MKNNEHHAYSVLGIIRVVYSPPFVSTQKRRSLNIAVRVYVGRCFPVRVRLWYTGENAKKGCSTTTLFEQ